jgi:hypothetical protein
MSCVALCFGRIGSWAGAHPGARRARQWVTGGVFLSMGLGLGLAGGATRVRDRPEAGRPGARPGRRSSPPGVPSGGSSAPCLTPAPGAM